MDDKTDELTNKLTAVDSSNALYDYVNSIDGKYPEDLKTYLKQILEEKHMSTADLQKKSHIDRTYIYQIMDGSKKPGRDKIISIALGAGMDLAQCQRALVIAQEGILYPKNKRDSVIIYAINNQMSVMDLNALLEEYEVPTLK
ncbi:MAG: helix-turn-helix transcriptional regulator [Saccharofermentans sp.]|nr:helix-turn-helix transcriptional regulator [Saccharofermentans sp.]